MLLLLDVEFKAFANKYVGRSYNGYSSISTKREIFIKAKFEEISSFKTSLPAVRNLPLLLAELSKIIYAKNVYLFKQYIARYKLVILAITLCFLALDKEISATLYLHEVFYFNILL